MKKSFIVLLLILTVIRSNAQFTLDGKISHYNPEKILAVNIPFIYGFYNDNTLKIPVDKTGSFHITVPSDEKKFIYFLYGDSSFILLASPGKNLHLQLDSLGGRITRFTGTANAENKLLYNIHLNEIPFFMQAGKDKALYDSITPASIKSKVIDPWHAYCDKQQALVAASNCLPADKALIASEINYNTVLQLDYYGGSYLSWKRPDRMQFIIDLYKDQTLEPSTPTVGLQYYYFADNFFRHLETKAYAHYLEGGSRNDLPLDYFQVSFDSSNTLIKEKGKTWLNWLCVKNNSPHPLTEKWLAQNIQNKYRDKDLASMRYLLAELNTLFPGSIYNTDLNNKKTALEKIRNKNLDNKDIRIVQDYKQVNSIYNIINTLKGKVVYLDVWGTWCPPCRAELRYGSALKNQFKDKDLVFLYLDMDEEEKDESWKEFIKVNELTGLHLRKNRKDIAAFWEELLPGKNDQQQYPTYFIFGRDGKLAIPQSKRPSDQQELYKQLEAVLNK